MCFCWFDLKCVAPGPRGTGIPSLRVTDYLHPPFPGTGGTPEHGTFILKPGWISHSNSGSAEALCFQTLVFWVLGAFMTCIAHFPGLRPDKWDGFNGFTGKGGKRGDFLYCSFIFVLSNIRITRQDGSSFFNLPFPAGASQGWGVLKGGRGFWLKVNGGHWETAFLKVGLAWRCWVIGMACLLVWDNLFVWLLLPPGTFGPLLRALGLLLGFGVVLSLGCSRIGLLIKASTLRLGLQTAARLWWAAWVAFWWAAWVAFWRADWVAFWRAAWTAFWWAAWTAFWRAAWMALGLVTHLLKFWGS